MKTPIAIATAALLGAAAFFAIGPAASAESVRLTPPPQMVVPATVPREVAYFAGGCFWGVEGVFEHVKGVHSAVSGYAGGTSPRPDYDKVSTGRTGYAETVKVTYDPRVVRYADLLRVYFSVVADPTTLNRQGPDTGTHYRTALFPITPAQVSQARAYITQLRQQRVFPRAIVTRVEPLRSFTPAEAYHQDFMAKNPTHPYIVVNDRPKVAALRRLFPAQFRG